MRSQRRWPRRPGNPESRGYKERILTDSSDASKPAGSPRPSGGGSDEHHMIFMERVEDEYFVRIDHEMTKIHYISFIAAVSSDRCQMVKLYPEGEAEVRFKICGVRRICFYCNRDGLFSQDVVKGIDDNEKM